MGVTARVELEELYEECLRAVEVESASQVWEEVELIITPAMREATRKRNTGARGGTHKEAKIF